MRRRTSPGAQSLEHRAWTLARTALVLALVLTTSPAGRIQAEPQPRSTVQHSRSMPIEGVELGLMPAEVHESSGLGVSRSYPGVVWTHNDSGDEPRFFAVDASASLLGTVRVVGANARDWEAMALGVCPGASDRSCLYLGDTGDNNERRDSVVVYVVEEPDPYAGDGDAGLVGAVSFRYPDGPHDAEGLAVTAAGDLVVVTKGRRRPIRVFEIPASDVVNAIDTGVVVTLREGRGLGLEWEEGQRLYATGADLDTGNRVLAVRTYREIHFFEWPMAEPPVRVGDVCIVGFTEPQGEAVGFRNDGWVITTSESPRGLRGALRAVRCPGIVGR